MIKLSLVLFIGFFLVMRAGRAGAAEPAGDEKKLCTVMSSVGDIIYPPGPFRKIRPPMAKDGCLKICEGDKTPKDKGQACLWGDGALWNESSQAMKLCHAEGQGYTSEGDVRYFPMSRDQCLTRSLKRFGHSNECGLGRLFWGDEKIDEHSTNRCWAKATADSAAQVAVLDVKHLKVYPFAPESSNPENKSQTWQVTFDRHSLGQITTQGKSLVIQGLDKIKLPKATPYLVLTKITKNFWDPGSWQRLQDNQPELVRVIESIYVEQVRPHTYLVNENRTVLVQPKIPSPWFKIEKIYIGGGALRLVAGTTRQKDFEPIESSGRGDNVSEPFGRHWFLEVKKGVFKSLAGRDYQLIDIGDYDGDNRAEFVFQGSVLDEDGKPHPEFLMFNDQAFIIGDRQINPVRGVQFHY